MHFVRSWEVPWRRAAVFIEPEPVGACHGLRLSVPRLALHYITAHGYLPPQDFIAAVMTSPVPGTEAYHEALRPANRGLPVPLRSPAEAEADHEAMREEWRILTERRRRKEGGHAEGSGLHQE